MRVISFVVYSGRSSASRDNLHAALLVRALKHLHKTISKTAQLDMTCGWQALDWFGYLSAASMRIRELPSPITLIPVPNSACVVGASATPHTLALARSIADHAENTSVLDCLRWKQPMRPSHFAGTRDVQTLCRNMVFKSKTPPCETVVLVDDVVTTGAHLRASAYTLTEAGLRCNEAICVARAQMSPYIQRSFGISQTVI
jgi:predicted amidophosphoribosyltransferase